MTFPRLVVGWNGLPAYGARLIRSGRDRLGYEFPVLATRPNVPIKGMEEILGGNLTWLDPNLKPCWSDLGYTIPDVFIHTGWGYPFFLSLADEVRAKGGKVVGMFDNCWKGNIRQLLGGVFFRIFLKRKYSAAWVPGASGRKLARYIGFSKSRIFDGMYGADPSVFVNQIPIDDRPKQILFVGRLENRKGILELISAFDSIRLDYPDWTLKIIGEGPFSGQLLSNEQMEIVPFKQPKEISEQMNRSRIFVLPSREEHWGLVVHEAALSGCVLALRDSIGAGADLASPINSVLFDKTSPEVIGKSLRRVLSWNNSQFVAGSKESLILAANYGPVKWGNTLEAVIKALGNEG